ncbi:MAG: hypothetical protein IPM23_03995 [Candidatus Melainabacteria bacterium]|nr:hypothetical protein [Candidatus Melainabacteria bacterium]
MRQFIARCFLLLLAATCIAGCGGSESQRDYPFSDTATRRVFLSDESGNTRYRIVDYAADGLTPIRETLNLPDGTSRLIEYRPDRTVMRQLEFYDGKAGQEPKLKKEVVYAPDGMTYLSHSTFTIEGVRLNDGLRESNGKYHTRFYYEDGTTLRYLATTGADTKTESEEHYRRDGSRSAVTTYRYSAYENRAETVNFDSAGVAIYSVSTGLSDDSEKKFSVYFPGTRDVRLEVYQRVSGGSVTLFNLNNERVKAWSFDGQKLTVDVYVPGNSGYELAYVQYYTRVPGLQDDPDSMIFELDAVRDFYYENVRDQYGYSDRRIARLIEFEPGKSKPSHLVIREAYSYSREQLVQHLDENAKVIKEERTPDEFDEEPTVVDINPPADPKIPLRNERFRYDPFELPDYIDLPRIEVRPLP